MQYEVNALTSYFLFQLVYVIYIMLLFEEEMRRGMVVPTAVRCGFARNDANGGMFLRGRFVKRPYTGTVQNQKAHGGLP